MLSVLMLSVLRLILVMLIVLMVIITYLYWHAKYRNAERVVMLIFMKLSVIMLNVNYPQCNI
jgi:hypothetical protein